MRETRALRPFFKGRTKFPPSRSGTSGSGFLGSLILGADFGVWASDITCRLRMDRIDGNEVLSKTSFSDPLFDGTTPGTSRSGASGPKVGSSFDDMGAPDVSESERRRDVDGGVSGNRRSYDIGDLACVAGYRGGQVPKTKLWYLNTVSIESSDRTTEIICPECGQSRLPKIACRATDLDVFAET
jgi:hypothetical protein